MAVSRCFRRGEADASINGTDIVMCVGEALQGQSGIAAAQYDQQNNEGAENTKERRISRTHEGRRP